LCCLQAAGKDGSDEPAAGPTHFIVLSNAGHQIQDTVAQLRAMHAGAQMSGGGTQAVFLDVGMGREPNLARNATVAIGFQCVLTTCASSTICCPDTAQHEVSVPSYTPITCIRHPAMLSARMLHDSIASGRQLRLACALE